MITIAENALEHIIQLMLEQALTPDECYLRVGVKGGGCSGLSYVMHFDTEAKETDEIVNLDAIKVLIDKKSVLYLFGTQLEYSDGLNGKGFHWVNPNASRTCGCGTSFSV